MDGGWLGEKKMAKFWAFPASTNNQEEAVHIFFQRHHSKILRAMINHWLELTYIAIREWSTNFSIKYLWTYMLGTSASPCQTAWPWPPSPCSLI
jgi:hypothetical protein